MSRKYASSSQPLLPPYAVCEGCGEVASAALVAGEDGQVICLNCRDTTHHPTNVCTICARELPCELHHVASRSHYPTFTTPLCLNCHQVLYARQYRWRRDGCANHSPFRYLLIGVVDIIRLFFERSPVAWACRQLFTLLVSAAALALGALNVPALIDVGHALAAIEGNF